MTDQPQNPSPTPRGRHVQQRTSQVSARQTPQGVRPAAHTQTGGFQTGQQGARRTGDPRAQGYRPPQQGAMAPVPLRGNRGRVQGDGHNKPPKSSGPWRIVFWVALVVLVASLVALGALAFSYWQGQNVYKSVAQEAFATPMDIEKTPLAEVAVDWEKLKAINPDTVGWIYIPGTVVNYPIVHTSNDDKYLTYDFNGQQSWGATYGSIFLSAANAGTFSDANNIVYGHNLNNGDMFASMAGFGDAANFNGHRTIYLLTPQGNYRLTTFSLLHVPADDPLAVTTFATDEERIAYMQDKLDRSVVAADPAGPTAADIMQSFAFVTCDNLPSDGRYVLFASVAETAGIAALGDEVVDPSATAAVADASEGLAA